MLHKLSDTSIAALFRHLEKHDKYVFLDTSKPDEGNHTSLLFVDPVERLQYHSGDDLQNFLQRLNNRLDRGYYLAGWFGYEFLHRELIGNESTCDLPSADLGVFRKPMFYDHRNGKGDLPVEGNGVAEAEASCRIDKLRSSMGRDEYCQAIHDILAYIAAGDTYQVNYTFRFDFDFRGSVASLYRRLRRSQPVPYGCCIKNDGFHVLSFSPELFFRIEQGLIYARPMKGTIKRGRNKAEDIENARFLGRDVKNRSENVMIVDLLRNDLSRLVAATGGGQVRTESLFDIERYRTVFQMTSTIVADQDRERTADPQEIFNALFPCGSVTGAPKIRTMEIIDELEKERRGIYTGAIGYLSPTREGVFNVPIRTVVLDGEKGQMGIGSGIVADSSPEQEWEECLLKADFLTSPPPEFKLIETLFYSPQSGYLLLEEHLDRLKNSAEYFDFPYRRQDIFLELERIVNSIDDDRGRRVRLLLEEDGTIHCSAVAWEVPRFLSFEDEGLDTAEKVSIGFTETKIDSSNAFLFHKTTVRQHYDEAYRDARSSGLFDVLFCNERDEITEGCISNLIIRRDGCLYTPPVSCGLLGGVMRAHLLARGSLPVVERILRRQDVTDADQLYVCNSVRGIVPVRIRTSE